jgi:hypothetical protein
MEAHRTGKQRSAELAMPRARARVFGRDACEARALAMARRSASCARPHATWAAARAAALSRARRHTAEKRTTKEEPKRAPTDGTRALAFGCRCCTRPAASALARRARVRACRAAPPPASSQKKQTARHHHHTHSPSHTTLQTLSCAAPCPHARLALPWPPHAAARPAPPRPPRRRRRTWTRWALSWRRPLPRRWPPPRAPRRGAGRSS